MGKKKKAAQRSAAAATTLPWVAALAWAHLLLVALLVGSAVAWAAGDRQSVAASTAAGEGGAVAWLVVGYTANLVLLYSLVPILITLSSVRDHSPPDFARFPLYSFCS